MSIIKLFFMGIWSILCITTSLFLLLITWNRKVPLSMARTIWAPGILFISQARTKVEGKENIEKGKTYIIVSNHSSYLDIPTLFKSIPINIHFIAKKELKKTPFLGWYMSATGMIFIDRGNSALAKKSLDDASRLIANGKTVLIFPEGTVSTSGKTLPFKSGGFHIAVKAGVEILPVKLEGTGKIWPGDSNTKLKKGKVQIKIGEPIKTSAYSEKEIKQLMELVRNKIEAL